MDDVCSRIGRELLPDLFGQSRAMVRHRKMLYAGCMFEQVVAPEGTGKRRAAEIVDHGLDSHSPVAAAFYEIAVQMHRVVGGTGQDIAAPDDADIRL